MSNDENTLVAGSSPAIRTSFPEENGDSGASDLDDARIVRVRINWRLRSSTRPGPELKSCGNSPGIMLCDPSGL